eukprot:gene9651-1855_t
MGIIRTFLKASSIIFVVAFGVGIGFKIDEKAKKQHLELQSYQKKLEEKLEKDSLNELSIEQLENLKKEILKKNKK